MRSRTVILDHSGRVEEIAATLIAEMAFHDEPEAKRERHRALALGGLLADAANKGCLDWSGFNEDELALIGDEKASVAMTFTVRRIQNHMAAAHHAMFFVRKAQGHVEPFPFGPRKESIEAMFEWGQADMRWYKNMVADGTYREDIEYGERPKSEDGSDEPENGETGVISYERWVFKPALPVMHLAIALNLMIHDIEVDLGRKLSILEIVHDRELVDIWLRRASVFESVVHGVWEDRISRCGQISFEWSPA
jgi:hypothetical protein